MEGIYRKEGGARKFSAKEKKGLFQAGHLPLGRTRGLLGRLSHFLWGPGEGPYDRLPHW